MNFLVTDGMHQGPKIAIRLEEYPVGSTKYYAKANDVKDNPLDSSMSGRVVCMYPKNSYCFENSYESNFKDDINHRSGF